MADDIFDFPIGLRCRLSELGMARSPRAKMTKGTVVGKGTTRHSLRVLFDGTTTPVRLHKKYIEAIPDPRKQGQAKRPRDVANRSRTKRDGRKVESERFLRKTFTLPLHAARLQARRILDALPSGGYMTIVESWRQLPDGQIEFTVRRLPTAD
jgi:hypothetical protein